MRGTLKRKTDRGFGFVAPLGDASREGEHFLHANQMTGGVLFKDLQVGDVLAFESVLGDKGLVAVRAELVKGE